MNADRSVAIEWPGADATAWSTSNPAADPMPSAHASHAAMHSGPGADFAGCVGGGPANEVEGTATRADGRAGRSSGRAAAARGARTRRPPRPRRARAAPVRRRSPRPPPPSTPSPPRHRARAPRLRPERELQHHGVADGGPVGQVQEPGQPQRRQLGRLADEQRLDEGDRVGGVVEPLELRDARARGRRTPRAPLGAHRRSPRRRPEAARPRRAMRTREPSAGNRLAAGLSSIISSGCPDAGVVGVEQRPPAVGGTTERVADVESRLRGATHEQRQETALGNAASRGERGVGVRRSAPRRRRRASGRGFRRWRRRAPADPVPAAAGRAGARRPIRLPRKATQTIDRSGTKPASAGTSASRSCAPAARMMVVMPTASRAPHPPTGLGTIGRRTPTPPEVWRTGQRPENISEISAASACGRPPRAAGRGVLPDLLGARRARDHARHRRLREQPAEGRLEHRDAALASANAR